MIKFKICRTKISKKNINIKTVLDALVIQTYVYLLKLYVHFEFIFQLLNTYISI